MRSLLLIFALFVPIAMANESAPNSQGPLTHSGITGHYYFARDNFIRDAYITTPINGKFYFRFFIAQTPNYGAMVVQYYNEVDGVATFDKEGVAHFNSPYGNCELHFLFKSINLLIDQKGSCGMSADVGMEVRGVYKQVEAF